MVHETGAFDETAHMSLHDKLLEEAAGFVNVSERTHAQRSLNIFFLSNPIRLFCAKVRRRL